MHFSPLNVGDEFRCEDGFYLVRIKQIEGDIVTVKLYFRGKFMGVIHAASHNNFQSLRAFPQRLGIRLSFEMYNQIERVKPTPEGLVYVNEGNANTLDLSIQNQRDLKQHLFRVPFFPFNSLEVSMPPWKNRADVQLEFFKDVLCEPASLRDLTLRKHTTKTASSRYSTRFELVAWTGDFIFPIRYYIYTELLPLLGEKFGGVPRLVDAYRDWVSETSQGY